VLQAVEIASVVADAIASAQAAMGAACPAIAGSPQRLVARADSEMLRAALLNLLLNACQSGSEQVDVSAGVAGDACQIVVSDRGPGIPPDIMDRIFDAFYTTKKSGTGLGLPIVKRLMDLQQGAVSIRTREGGGTIAELTIPLVRQPAPAPRG
jgi:signal transduction histidine kinase